MLFARIDAVATWVYAAGFGIPAIPIAISFLNTGRLPTFFNLFPMYGGRWSTQLGHGTFAALLIAFFLVTVLVAYAAWLIWRGKRVGAVLSIAILPLEAFCWVGFDLPVPWVFGVARVVLIFLAWSSLKPRGVTV
jgi:hypothetical protein